MSVLKNSLVSTGIEYLAENIPLYAEHLSNDRKIRDDLITPLEHAIRAPRYRPHRAVAEALFESRYLSTDDSCFNTEQLFSMVYGVKAASKVDMLIEAHAKLTELGYTEDSKTYNTSGDNYFSAYSFDTPLSTTSISVLKMSDSRNECASTVAEKEAILKKKQTLVVIAENQSPMYAYVLKPNTFGDGFDTLQIVRIRTDYDSKTRLPEFLELVKNNALTNDHKWSAYSNNEYGIITTLKIEDQSCTPVIEPKSIESGLFNIASLHCCVMSETEMAE